MIDIINEMNKMNDLKSPKTENVILLIDETKISWTAALKKDMIRDLKKGDLMIKLSIGRLCIVLF